jgi:chemotaxis protein CheY-P-specific phosphatase CheC
MDAERKAVLEETIAEILEKQAFMFAMPVSKTDMPETGDAVILAGISFDGEMKGMLKLAAPDRLSLELAANMLGLDADSPEAEEQRLSAIKELLNIACGNILTVIAGVEPVFNIAIPEVETIGQDQWRDLLNDEESVALMIDDIPILIKLAL